MDVNTVYLRSVECFADRVNSVKEDQWGDPTPCTEWTVRDLANHVTNENLWTVPLMEGRTMEEVGDRFDGDVLGDDPIGSALAAARAASETAAAQLAKGGTVQLSFGETPKEEYAMQLAADNLIHSWDMAAAIGGDTRLEPPLVHAIAKWFDDREELYRGGGAISARGFLTGDDQHDLLARFGRDGAWGPQPQRPSCRFNAAFGAGRRRCRRSRWSPTTSPSRRPHPPPTVSAHEGHDAVRTAWTEVMQTDGHELHRGGVLRVRRPRSRACGATPGRARTLATSGAST